MKFRCLPDFFEHITLMAGQTKETHYRLYLKRMSRGQLFRFGKYIESNADNIPIPVREEINNFVLTLKKV
jgi:hypothetical protein